MQSILIAFHIWSILINENAGDAFLLQALLNQTYLYSQFWIYVIQIVWLLFFTLINENKEQFFT